MSLSDAWLTVYFIAFHFWLSLNYLLILLTQWVFQPRKQCFTFSCFYFSSTWLSCCFARCPCSLHPVKTHKLKWLTRRGVRGGQVMLFLWCAWLEVLSLRRRERPRPTMIFNTDLISFWLTELSLWESSARTRWACVLFKCSLELVQRRLWFCSGCRHFVRCVGQDPKPKSRVFSVCTWHLWKVTFLL